MDPQAKEEAMKTKFFVLSIILAATVFLLLTRIASVSAQNPATQLQTVQVQAPVLSEKDALKNVRVDESSGVGTGVLPDLTIKDMCLEVDLTTSAESLRVLLANIGTRSADPFELGIKFIDSSDDTGYWYVDNLIGLNAGEEKWLSYSPRCCGVAPTHRVVKESVKFQAIADPTYLKAYGGYVPPYPVKSRITELNEGNNSLTFSRAEIKSCKNIGRPTTPKIQTIKPVRP